MKAHRIAIVGTGMIARSHAAAIQSLPNAQCAAVADVIPQKAEARGRELGCHWYTDTFEMLVREPGIDVCILSLPTNLHARYAVMCLEAGKAVLCEKPLELHLEGALRIQAAVERTGSIFMTAQVVRFWPGYDRIRKMHQSGELGEIRMSYFSRCSQPQRWDNDWLFDPQSGGGALHDMMVHDLDYMNCLFGEARTVYALASKDETGCYANVFASLRYRNGALGVAETSFTMKSGYPFTMYAKLMGSRATVEYTYRAGFDINAREGAESRLCVYREGRAPVIERPPDWDPYARQLAYFLGCVEDGRQPDVVTIKESVEVIRTVDAVKRSADSGCAVDL